MCNLSRFPRTLLWFSSRAKYGNRAETDVPSRSRKGIAGSRREKEEKTWRLGERFPSTRACAIQFIWTGDPRSGETRLGVSAPPRLCGLRTLVARSRPKCRGTPRRAPLAITLWSTGRSMGRSCPYTSDPTRRAAIHRKSLLVRVPKISCDRVTRNSRVRVATEFNGWLWIFTSASFWRRRWRSRCFCKIFTEIRIFHVGSRHVLRFTAFTRACETNASHELTLLIRFGYDGASLSFDDRRGEWKG